MSEQQLSNDQEDDSPMDDDEMAPQPTTKKVTYFVKNPDTGTAKKVTMKRTAKKTPKRRKPFSKVRRKRRPPWQPGEVFNLIHAAIEREDETRPYFRGEYGTNDIREDAWDFVAGK